MAEFKEIKTRIALKQLTYAEWEAIKDTYKPLRGEVCFCEIPEGNAEATNAPTVLFKVGDGVNVFGQLNWASALAADVYDWAKENSLHFTTEVTTSTVGEGENAKTYVGNAITDAQWDSALNNGKGGIKLTKGAQFATKKELDEAIKAFTGGIGSINDTDTKYGFSIETTGDYAGKLKITSTKTINGSDDVITYEYIDIVTHEDLTKALEGYSPIDNDTQYHIEYDSANKEIKLVAGPDDSKMAIDATDFIKDGMIKSVELVDTDDKNQEGKFLKITWNIDDAHTTDEGTDVDVTYVDVTTLLNIYTADGTTLTEVDGKFSIANEGVDTAQIADSAVTEDKLEATINQKIVKADTALQKITTTKDGGLTVTNNNHIDIDTNIVFVLDCNWS